MIEAKNVYRNSVKYCNSVIYFSCKNAEISAEKHRFKVYKMCPGNTKNVGDLKEIYMDYRALIVIEPMIIGK